jgi:hypothetical protein
VVQTAYTYVAATNVSSLEAGAASVAGGIGARRRLAQSAYAPSAAPSDVNPHMPPANAMCTVYYRQMSFLSMLTLTTSPPSSCGGGYCANTTWLYGEAPLCGATYEVANLPISAAVYAADVASHSAWCADWSLLFTAPRAAVSLRAATDPYVVAGELTNCSYTFANAGAEYANAGFFFIIPGMAISLVAFFCLEGMCSPMAFMAAFGGGANDSVNERAAAGPVAGEGFAAPAFAAPNYGSTAADAGAVELRASKAWPPAP